MDLKNKFKKKEQTEKRQKKASVAGVRTKKTLGVLSATSIVLIIIIAVLANVLVSKGNWSYDVTDNKIFSISSQSKKIVKNLKQDITIYFLDSKKNVDDNYLQIAQQYKKNSKHVSIKYRDLELYPNFGKDYVSSSESIEAGGILVVSGEKGRYISSDDFIAYDMDSSGNYTTSINLEPSLTAAINYVISDKTPKIYTLAGQSEPEFDASFQSSIEADNYEFKELNLLTEKKVPDDCEILFIYAPKKDISADDLKKVETYLKNGGKLFYVCNTEAGQLKNFESLLTGYGIKINDGIVVETDSSKYMQNYPTYILPTIESTTVTDSLLQNSSYVLTPVSKGLTLSDNAISLLSTSDGAYSKTNLESKTVEKEKGDINGPFSLAAEVLDDNGNGKVIVVACPSMMVDQVDQSVSGANSNFVSNCVNALAQQEEKISIKAKSVSDETATYTTSAIQLVSFVSVIGIPVVLLVIGIVVVVMRRKSK